MRRIRSVFILFFVVLLMPTYLHGQTRSTSAGHIASGTKLNDPQKPYPVTFSPEFLLDTGRV